MRRPPDSSTWRAGTRVTPTGRHARHADGPAHPPPSRSGRGLHVDVGKLLLVERESARQSLMLIEGLLIRPHRVLQCLAVDTEIEVTRGALERALSPGARGLQLLRRDRRARKVKPHGAAIFLHQ